MFDITHHPCFNDAARHQFARIHLPVAPHCNIQCNFCLRVYDCANESRPGVTTAMLSPQQALRYLDAVLEKDPRIAVVGIAGPGDPFATPDTTMETLRLVRRRHPEMLLCVASNGLGIGPHVEELASLGVSHVTITINAVDPDIGAKIYAWVRDRKRICRGRDGAELLWNRQAEAIRALKQHGIVVKINAIVVPGVNDRHVAEVARQVSELGADIANCVPLFPVAETPFADVPSPTPEAIRAIRRDVSHFLPIMEHCTRCRADAVGLLGEPMRSDVQLCLLNSAVEPSKQAAERPYVAVATLEGVLVNQHLGEATQVAVFERNELGFHLVETRRTPPPGGGAQRWQALAETLKDCRAFLVASAGDSPRHALADEGIEVILMEGLIEDGLDAVFRGEPIRSPQRTHRCGSGCAGNGLGCS